MEKRNLLVYLYKYLKIISAYLNKKELSEFSISNEDLKRFYQLSKNNSLTALFYLAVKDTKISIDFNSLKKMEESYLLAIRKSVLFEKERTKLFQFLNNNRIDFLPLKGLVLKDYYLDHFSREFADNDILFEGSDSRIKDFFIKNGYEAEYYKENNHDVYIKKPFYNFEMHRDLFFPQGNSVRFVDYFKNYLKKSPIKEGFEHYLLPDDFYIYFTAHSYKHFANSGFGLRTLIDYYLYIKNEQLNFDYINQELSRLDLLEFSNSISSLSFKVFDGEPLNKDEEETLLFIAFSGTYGTLEQSIKKCIKEKGKFKYFIARVFPPYSYYKMPYPWAYYFPILIPIAWLVSFIKRVFRNPRRATNELKMISKQKKHKKE